MQRGCNSVGPVGISRYPHCPRFCLAASIRRSFPLLLADSALEVSRQGAYGAITWRLDRRSCASNEMHGARKRKQGAIRRCRRGSCNYPASPFTLVGPECQKLQFLDALPPLSAAHPAITQRANRAQNPSYRSAIGQIRAEAALAAVTLSTS